jgi:hypothetical protein
MHPKIRSPSEVIIFLDIIMKGGNQDVEFTIFP